MIARGWFVEVDDDRRFGKVVDAALDHLEVEFFNSIHERQTDVYLVSAVTRTYLSRQTRVYFTIDHGERWVMGRVRNYHMEGDGSVTYEIRSPNHVDRDVSERDLYARCHGPGGDPAEVLSLGAAEAQIWHDARWSARDALSRLRSAAGGLEGLSSASVELVPHQADAVQRVLLDPLQRYLLADEVGLGKTVEAGAIIAQTILDDSRRRVVVLVPDALVGQWTKELRCKFGLDATASANLAVASHSDGHMFDAPHLLVVDEAHRCIADPTIHGPIAELAAGAEKLLLLTATPVIGNERAFLGLLRWLDQARWGAESEVGFDRHVRASQEYGRLLLGLRPDASPFLLKQRVASARSTFPDDNTIDAIADKFAASDSIAAREEACADLRDHIADTYRIYHRLVRARRSDLDGWEFQARRNASVREEDHDEDAVGEAGALLEDWRASAILAVDAYPALEDELAARYVGLLECMGRGVTHLSNIDFVPIFKDEGELLDAIGAVGRFGDASERPRFVAEVVERQLSFLIKAGGQSPKVVVFTSDDATTLAARLRIRVGEKAVIGPGGDLDRFRSDSTIVVGVFDQRAEEGLNLHFADAIIHADLPFSVQRLEQRIGRLDRFGRSKGPIRHAVVVPGGEDGSPWSAWLDLLRSGFEIFDRPASDIQFALESIEREIWRRLLREGGTGLGGYVGELKARIAHERQTLDEQYALDQLALSREPSRRLVERMEEAEADEGALAREVGGLLRLMQFEGRMTGDVFSLSWTRDTLLPERPWKPVFENALKRPLTWRRRVAEGRSDVGLLRPGAGLVEALERLLDWDDRGSAFATWRERPGWGSAGEERLAFRLCWVVGPQPIAGTGLLVREDKAGLRRQAQAALPPWTEVQHLGGDLAPISDGALLTVLSEPYRPDGEGSGGRDYNLGSRAGWLDRVVDPGTFKRLCRDVRAAGLARLEAGEGFQGRVARAVQSVGRDNARFLRRARTRPGSGEASIVGAAEGNDVLDAVSRPVSRLDSVGVFVVAGHAPRKVGL